MLAKGKSRSSRPHILLLGKNGQIGGELCPLLAEFAQLYAADRRALDLAHPTTIRELVRSLKPDVIVNAAAYTAVDRAESEPGLATAINTIAPAVLAEEAAKLGTLLVHYSTDYVFDGTKSEPYEETDSTNPLNVYGKTKAAGEEAIRAMGCDHFIFRTSWVYGTRGSNFLLRILELAQEKEELRIVNDQVGAPTSSKLIAQATANVLKRSLQDDQRLFKSKLGTYHMTASGQVSWFGFASEILQQSTNLTWRVRNVIPISSSDYPAPARRPLTSRLNCEKISSVLGVVLPTWQAGLGPVLDCLSSHQ